MGETFIDDDAVAEPHWLTHLAAPFVDPAVDAAGGFVVGANGISLEWAGGTVDRNLVTGALDLRGADLRYADLSGVDFSQSSMRGADLRGAILRGATLYGVDMRGAHLSGADLQGANMHTVRLRGAHGLSTVTRTLARYKGAQDVPRPSGLPLFHCIY